MSWDDARARAHAAARPLPAVHVELAAASGATLAEPLTSLVDLPSFDRSAMDGYAVCGEGPWTVVGEVLAGSSSAPRLTRGQACEVATGALLPEATTAVLPYENAVREGRQLTGPVSPGGHIRRAGEECGTGEPLAPSGAVVSPQLLGLAAAAGHDRLRVHPKPRVRALVTGDEVCVAGIPPIGQVRDAIGPMLPGLVDWAGGTLTATTYLPDSTTALAEGLAQAEADVILVSGSSSIGPADHLRDCIDRLGGQLWVDGVRCRPGHPQALAALPDGRLLIGLPGNPLAALVGFLTLVVPAITGLRGAALDDLPAVSDSSLPRHPTSTRLLPIRTENNGRLAAVNHHASAMLRGVAMAEALAVVPPEGSDCPVRLHGLPG
ncbi:molybdopterin molybdotransferase MoeA [Pseudonocardia asaccharolytica]|uniref:molybdopterin molybdotransferase MoeA n=1 Tax=Pseudonocardia asaccharolytica TaxID=54010 RepID=UPI0006884E05|nr:molybdopterin molybdotransferase MoeA [Pseudonocardia asaccharolytica]